MYDGLSVGMVKMLAAAGHGGHVYTSRTLEVEAGGSGAQDQSIV